MKPAPFDYVRAETLAEAHAVLAAEGSEASVIAGGQTLVPLLSMRMARPACWSTSCTSRSCRHCDRGRQHSCRRGGAPSRSAGVAGPRGAPATARACAALDRARADAFAWHGVWLHCARRSERGAAADAGGARRRRHTVVGAGASRSRRRRLLHRPDVDRARRRRADRSGAVSAPACRDRLRVPRIRPAPRRFRHRGLRGRRARPRRAAAVGGIATGRWCECTDADAWLDDALDVSRSSSSSRRSARDCQYRRELVRRMGRATIRR